MAYPVSATTSTARTGYNSRYLSAPRGGATVAGRFATPGYQNPFVQGGGVSSIAANSGSAQNYAMNNFNSYGSTGGVQGGFSSSFGMGGGRGGRGGYGGGGSMAGTFRGTDGTRMAMGPHGPIPVGGRINARAQLSPNTGRGLSDYYANQVLPGSYDNLQRMQSWQQDWLEENSPNLTSLAPPGKLDKHFNNFKEMQSKVQWRRRGGPVSAQPYIVNEEGVEAYQPKGGDPQLIGGPQQVFFPPQDGKIIPHRKTVRMMESGLIPGASSLQGPKYRARGGPVAASGHDPAMQWYMANAQAAQAPRQESYQDLYARGRGLGLNMTNAPKTVRGLRRFLDMGQNTVDGIQEGRAAAQYSLENQPQEQEVPLRRLRRGETASVYFGPRTSPGMFSNDAGEQFPMTSNNPWQTTWPQANILDRRRVRIPGRGYTFDDIAAQIESEDFSL